VSKDVVNPSILYITSPGQVFSNVLGF